MLRHGFFFLNEVHKKILMENIDTMEQILQKNKKTFPVWNITKKLKWYTILEMVMRNNII